MYWLKRIILASFGSVVNNLGRLTLGLLVALCLGHAVTLIPEVGKYKLLSNLMALTGLIEAPILNLLRGNIPTVATGIDFAPGMIMTALFMLWIGFLFERERIENFQAALGLERDAELQLLSILKEEKAAEAAEARSEKARVEAEKAAVLAKSKAYAEAEKRAAAAMAAAQKKAAAEAAQAQARLKKEKLRVASEFEKMSNDGAAAKVGKLPPTGSKREELLELYAQTKKTLEESKKNLSFLAIDVVNSTGMKLGEDPALAERDFRQYKKLVQKAIADNNGLKAAWTPDGVMICFGSVQTAVQAAQQVIKGLEHFNKNIKAMKADFQVRAGINAGRVLFDDEVPMQEMSDRTIDIAGHMQKYAGVNNIFIGKAAIESMRANTGFKPVDKKVDGCDVMSWGPDAKALAAG